MGDVGAGNMKEAPVKSFTGSLYCFDGGKESTNVRYLDGCGAGVSYSIAYPIQFGQFVQALLSNSAKSFLGGFLECG